ncbi:MAG: translocation/assembly module TamB [Paludibacteraceae bacterium]|nr:translocation/assembly module TamB [Paludibacteraceae bacterium]
MQSKIVNYVTEWVEGKTGTDVSIGRVDVDLFNGVFIDDLYLEDQSGDTLLFAKRVSANASLFSAYYGGKLHLQSAKLSDFKVYLSKDSISAPFNFQFLIDAFATKDTVEADTPPSNFDLSIAKINLYNGRFKYDMKSDSLTPSLFNPSHIHVDSLMAEMQLHSIRMEKLEAGVSKLSLKEWSGIDLENLSVYAQCKDSVITSDLLTIKLPNTQVELANIQVDLRNLSMNSHVMDGLHASVEIFPSHVSPADLKAFLPDLALLKDTLGISCSSISADLPSAKVSDFNAYYGDGMLCTLSVSTSDVCHVDSSLFDLSLNHLFVTSSSVSNLLDCFSPTTKMPELIEKSDHLELSLFAKGFLNDLDIDMDLNSQPGELKAFGSVGYDMKNGEFHTDVDLESNELKMGALLDSSIGLGNIAMRAKAVVSIPREGSPDIAVSGGFPLITYKDYLYRNIDLDARYFGENSIEMSIALPDSNANLLMKGRILNIGSDSMDCDLMADLDHLSLYNLHLTNDEEMRSFGASTRLRLRSHGNSLDNLTCRLVLDSTYMQSDTMQVLVEHLLLSMADNSTDSRRIDLMAPYFSLFIEGKYDFLSLADCFTNMLHPYLPTFFPYVAQVDSTKNDFSFGLDVLNTERISSVMHLPILVDKPAVVSGYFRPATLGLLMNADIPSMKSGNNVLENVKVDAHLEREKNMYVLDVSSKYSNGKQKYPLNLNLHTEADHDVVLLSLDYDNKPCDFKLNGKLTTLVSFQKEAEDLVCVKLNFMPTDLQLNELYVEFEPAVVELRHKNISISDFGFSLDGQPFLMVNGRVTESEQDSLLVSFHRASVHHLLSAVNKQDVPVDAYLDGAIHLHSLLGTPRFFTNGFHVDDITYMNDSIGSLLLNSRWNTKYQGMRVSAVLNRSKDVAATADGYLSPANDRIKFDVHLNMLPLTLAELPLKGVLHNLSGYCGSDLQVTGKLSAPDINGYFYFKDAKATVDYTDVSYHISDTILFSPNRIMFRNFDLYDSKNKKLTINCAVHHKEFKDFRYTATLRMDDLLLLNNPSKKDSLLSGVFCASGAIDVRGDMNSAKVTGTLKNGNLTNVMIRLPESVTQVQTYDNIVYVTSSTEQDTSKNKPLVVSATDEKFVVSADVSVELTDDAVFGAIISSATGDAISFRGAGNINAKYDSETSNTKLFGQYTIKNGNLKLKLSQLPIKTFSIKEGSRVNFNGDPTACSIDITAGYRVRADLALLDPSFSSMGLPSTRVPVECDLNISGNLKQFDIKYDISLPEANEDLSRMVNSLITTDDIRIREFAYLLGFGMFYPPNGESEGNASIVSSLASSSISGALNSALSNLLGDRVTIGTDVSSSQEDLSDLEMNLSVSTNFFNNRLVLNTSLGYKNNTATEAEANDNALIGNFDAEYKLTKSGMFRLKAYNHANNEFYNSSSTTQGLGVVFVKEAKNFSGLFDLRQNQSMNTSFLPENTMMRNDSLSTKRDSMVSPMSEHPKRERSVNE